MRNLVKTVSNLMSRKTQPSMNGLLLPCLMTRKTPSPSTQKRRKQSSRDGDGVDAITMMAVAVISNLSTIL